ncbi:MAG: S8 family serine peptidase [Burkholderiales bacterium]|nr:S8 family serine peptidase [Burkholderiales bacterium]
MVGRRITRYCIGVIGALATITLCAPLVAGPGGLRSAPPPPPPPVTTPRGGSTVPDGGSGDMPRDRPFTTPWSVEHPDDQPLRPGQRPADGGPFALPVLHPDTIEPGELLVTWRSATDAAAGEAELTARFGIQPVERLKLAALRWHLARYRLSGNEQAAHVRQRLMREHPTWLADFNTRYAAAGAPHHYARDRIGIARASRDAGSRTPVGILDGPVAPVPALAQSLAASQTLLAAGETAASPTHGTAVAALIAGWDEANSFAGVAPGARLHAAVVMRHRAGASDTTTRNVVAGLDWLLGQRVEVINMSIGGPPNRLLAAAVFQIRKLPVALVSAAGNGGPDAEPVYPAAYPGVIAVTATDARDRIYGQANRGEYVALSAPGVDVWVPAPDGGFYATGTSFAAAMVSGAVARTLSQRAASRDSFATQLCRHARDLGEPGPDPVFGCGLLQLGAPKRPQ